MMEVEEDTAEPIYDPNDRGVADTLQDVTTSVLTVNVVVTVAGSAALGVAASARQISAAAPTEGLRIRDGSIQVCSSMIGQANCPDLYRVRATLPRVVSMDAS
jgi:hypothetical protein